MLEASCRGISHPCRSRSRRTHRVTATRDLPGGRTPGNPAKRRMPIKAWAAMSRSRDAAETRPPCTKKAPLHTRLDVPARGGWNDREAARSRSRDAAETTAPSKQKRPPPAHPDCGSLLAGCHMAKHGKTWQTHGKTWQKHGATPSELTHTAMRRPVLICCETVKPPCAFGAKTLGPAMLQRPRNGHV